MLFCINFLSTLLTNFALVFILTLKYELRISKKYINYIIFIYTIIVSTVNLLHMPTLNLIINLVVFYFINYTCFEKRNFKYYLLDGTLLFLCMMIDYIAYLFIDILIKNFSLQLGFEQLYMIRSISAGMLFILFLMVIQKRYFCEELSYLSMKDTLIYMFLPLSTLILIPMVNSGFPQTHVFESFIVTVVLFLMNIIMLKNYLSLNERYKIEILYNQELNKVEIDERYYQDLTEKYDETRRLIHDFKKHLTVISMMHETGHEVNDYISETAKRLDATHLSFYSKNRILDIVLNDKISLASQKDIDIDARISLEMMGDTLNFIHDFDLVSLFANILDNAIEAVEECEDKHISISIYNVGQMLQIEQTNTCHNELRVNKYKYISTKKDHKGLGLTIIQKTVEKYQGIFSIDIQNNQCFVLISIPIPDDN